MSKKTSAIMLLFALFLLGTLVLNAYACHGWVGNFVWEDCNSNGIQDVGELGIPGVTVELHDCSGVLLDSTVTDGAGEYYFYLTDPNPVTLELCVKFVAPDGYYFTLQNQGGDDEVDSDADPLTGMTECFSIYLPLDPGPYPEDYSWDAGLICEPEEPGLSPGYWKKAFNAFADLIAGEKPKGAIKEAYADLVMWTADIDLASRSLPTPWDLPPLAEIDYDSDDTFEMEDAYNIFNDHGKPWNQMWIDVANWYNWAAGYAPYNG